MSKARHVRPDNKTFKTIKESKVKHNRTSTTQNPGLILQSYLWTGFY